MGDVRRAHNLKVRLDVALKSVLREGLDTRTLEQLRQEVRAGREVISMEYIDGPTLVDLLQARTPLSLQEAAGIGAQFQAMVEAIHPLGEIIFRLGSLTNRRVIIGPATGGFQNTLEPEYPWWEKSPDWSPSLAPEPGSRKSSHHP